MLFTKLSTRTKTTLIIQNIAMLIGTSTHAHWIFQNGFLSPNHQASFLSTLFWDSLIFFDPLAAVLLITKPKIGLWLTAIIICVDILHNGILSLRIIDLNYFCTPCWFEQNWMLLLQLAFGLFVLITFRRSRNEIEQLQ